MKRQGSYYNEIDPKAAAWLRELIAAGLIAPGDVDERSIADVRPDDLAGYGQHHFFAGIGGWSYALRLAGWPDDRPVWTGSCPCQPFSAAGKGFVARRVESGSFPLVDGVAFRLADGRTREDTSRAELLKGIGNAIVPQVAAEFIQAGAATRVVDQETGEVRIEWRSE